MSNDNKTHFRKIFKSDHLAVADLEDFIESNKNLVFTISHVKQEIGARVAGRKGDFNIAYFKEPIKPLVLNAGNSKIMKNLTGSVFVEDWNNVPVLLYIDRMASFGGEVTGGVRINPNPQPVMKDLVEGTKLFDNAVTAYKRDGNLDSVTGRVNVTAEVEKAIKVAAQA